MPRLNPFALPVETDVRFGMLVVAIPAVILALAIGVLPLFYAGEAGGTGFVFLLEESVRRSGCDPDVPTSCDDETWGSAILVAVGYLGVVVGCCPGGLLVASGALAVWRFRGHPRRVLTRSQARHADATRDGALLAAIAPLAKASGLRRPPAISIGPPLAVDGQAFGAAASPQLRLGGGLRLLRVKNVARFRAIVLHELGHIVNGDTDRAYWAEAMWQALLPAAAVCLAGIFLTQLLTAIANGISFLAPVFAVVITAFLAVEAVTLIAVTALIWRGLLQVREFYADAHAQRSGAGAALADLLARSAEHQASHRPGWLRLHPSAADRLAVLKSPRALFALRWDMVVPAAFLLGVIASQSAMVFDLLRLIGLVSPIPVLGWLSALSAILVAMISAWGSASLLAHATGLQIVRQAAADLALPGTAREGLGLLRSAALTTLGFEAALWLIPHDSLTASPLDIASVSRSGDIDFLIEALSGLGRQALWMVVLFGVLWAGYGMLRVLAVRVLEMRGGPGVPHRAVRTLLDAVAWVWTFLLLGAVVFRYGLNGQVDWGVAAAGLGLLWLVAGLSALGVSATVYLRARPPRRCPECGGPIVTARATGTDCPHCSRPLAAWLYEASHDGSS